MSFRSRTPPQRAAHAHAHIRAVALLAVRYFPRNLDGSPGRCLLSSFRGCSPRGGTIHHGYRWSRTANSKMRVSNCSSCSGRSEGLSANRATSGSSSMSWSPNPGETSARNAATPRYGVHIRGEPGNAVASSSLCLRRQASQRFGRKELPVKLVDKGKTRTSSDEHRSLEQGTQLLGFDRPRPEDCSGFRQMVHDILPRPATALRERSQAGEVASYGTKAGGRRFRPGLPVFRRSEQHLIDPAIQAIAARRGQCFPGGKAPRQIESVEGHRKEFRNPESVTFDEERHSLRVVRKDLAEFLVAQMVYMKSLEPEPRVPKPVRIEGGTSTGDDAAGSMAPEFVKELLEIVDEPRATPEHPVIQTVEHQVATRLVLGQRPREHPLVFRFERLDDVESRPQVCVEVEEKWCWLLRAKSAHGADVGPFQDETLARSGPAHQDDPLRDEELFVGVHRVTAGSPRPHRPPGGLDAGIGPLREQEATNILFPSENLFDLEGFLSEMPVQVSKQAHNNPSYSSNRRAPSSLPGAA